MGRINSSFSPHWTSDVIGPHLVGDSLCAYEIRIANKCLRLSFRIGVSRRSLLRDGAAALDPFEGTSLKLPVF